MGTTNSTTKHHLNYYLETKNDENSGWSTWTVTNTGNQKKVKGLPVLNQTYTLSSNNKDLVINTQLLNWDDIIHKTGAELVFSAGNGNLEADQWYKVYGHPDKFVYDYQQEYSNCGVDSSLNILSMAGKKEIVELTTDYMNYLSSPKTTTKDIIDWNEETGSWEIKTETVSIYNKAETFTEDSFLLWAVQNSPNDKQWYEDRYAGDYEVDFTKPQDFSYTDYCVHTKNAEEYKTIDDLKGNILEVGGTTYIHRDNILEYWDVKSDVIAFSSEIKEEDKETYSVDKLEKGIDILVRRASDTVLEKVDLTEPEAIAVEWADGLTIADLVDEEKRDVTGTINVTFDETFTTKETITEIKSELPKGEEGDKTDKEETDTFNITVKEYTTNLEKYSYLYKFDEYIKDGKGVILSGYANAFIGGKGGGHAITLVGVVWGEVTTKETTYTINDKPYGNGTETERGDDIVGLYVIDTGGFLGNIEGAQLITPDMLYDFLTDSEYVGSPIDMEENPWIGAENAYTSILNVTQENIKNWAEDLNAIGNNRKNVIEGNRGNNFITGGNGNDVLRGDAGNDTLNGDNDHDTLYGGEGNDVLTGGRGDDTYVFRGTDSSSNDLIHVGQGKDVLQFDSYDGYKVEFGGYTSKITPIDDMYYQNRDGDLVIKYNITGNDGNFENSITVKDYFKKNLYSSISAIQEQTYTYDETKKTNVVVGETRKDFVTEFINRGHIDYYTEQDKKNKINGTKFKDYILTGNKNDSITAGDREDILFGGACNDTIKAGKDNDTIYASAGNDAIYGEAGINQIHYVKEFGSVFDSDEKITTNYGGNDTIYSGRGEDHIYLTDYTKAQANSFKYAKAKNDLVITYDETTGSSITISGYFSKKGKTSVKDIKLKDGGIDLAYGFETIKTKANAGLVVNKGRETTGQTIVGDYGYDKLTGSKYNDSITGGLGNDTIYGGNGDDTLVGGLGADLLYGQAGNNTYVFDKPAQGSDTIYVTGKGETILDFTGTATFNKTAEGINIGSTGCIDTYSYTKDRNNLVINYATDHKTDDNATVTIQGFFSSGNTFYIKDANKTDKTQYLNLKEDIAIYMEGDETKKSRITGSNYNDSIVGYDFNDTLNGGKGNDTLVGGKSNDQLTGGYGDNIIKYTKGDGLDTITLTKGENLDIKLDGFADTDKLDYTIVKNNLIISYTNADGETTDILNLKNFGTKDVTTATGSVELYVNGTLEKDLRNGDYLDTYNAFDAKKYTYNGNWHAEKIDGSLINYVDTPKDRGIRVNANAGNDTIIGSFHNDTINGGDGDDVIRADYGTNTVDGGKGNDTYKLFCADQNATIKNDLLNEKTTVKDTGKDAGAIDTVIVYDLVDDIKYDINSWNMQDTGYIWVDVDRRGNRTFHIASKEITKDGDTKINTATLSGVEKIIANGGTESVTTDDYIYNFDKIATDVDSWIKNNTKYKGLTDIKSIMNGGVDADTRNALLVELNKGWEQYTP